MNSVQNQSGLVLSVGFDPSLMSTRKLLLQSAGYLVESAYSVEEAFRRFLVGDFDVVVLCHSMSEPERHQLIALIRDSGSSAPVVVVTDTVGAFYRDGEAVVESDPATFLNEIVGVMGAERCRGK